VAHEIQRDVQELGRLRLSLEAMLRAQLHRKIGNLAGRAGIRLQCDAGLRRIAKTAATPI
jgi:hypothetical protein